MPRFDYFVILGGMRTGSNLLEEVLASVQGIRCYGEVFNPHFVGQPGRDELLGVKRGERDRNPERLLSRLAASSKELTGFRLFEDHDERVLTRCLAEPRVAKIVLTRHPVESYVSLKIARATGQWWLGDAKRARTSKVRFEPDEFDVFLNARATFYRRVLRALQTSGQTAFHLDYADLSDLEVIGGLVRFLGVDGSVDSSKVRARVQNPAPLTQKVDNFEEMDAALARADYFDLGRIPSFEPARGPGVMSFLVSEPLRCLFMPLRGGQTEYIADWMENAGGVPPSSGLRQRDLRRWKRGLPGHRSFTVVSHPVSRAYSAFSQRIVPLGEGTFPEIRAALIQQFGLALPDVDAGQHWTIDEERTVFLDFLKFLKSNLAGQTNLRVDPEWASQSGLLRSLSEVMVPDLVLRESDLQRQLPILYSRPEVTLDPLQTPPRLEALYDASVEAAARAVYARDYMMFGFGEFEP